MTQFFLIIGDELNEYQQLLVHEEVKRHSEEWWHQHPDIWVTDGGQSAQWWMERLSVVVPQLPSMIVVLRLPSEGERSWSARGPAHKWGWLYKNYASPLGGPAMEDYEVPSPPRALLPWDPDEEPF